MELLQEHGHKGERHGIITQDGYKLVIHRVCSDNKTISNPPILLVHGFLFTSSDWILLGPEKAFAYLLSDNGYDVWLGNSRGNTYSMDHETLDPLEKEFWNFSFHEMGYYDLPATIDYILNVTKQEKLVYAGHSQGATQLMVLLSTRSEYNSKIVQAHLLGPVTFSSHMPHPFAHFFAENFDDFAAGVFNFGPSPEIMEICVAICANPMTVAVCYSNMKFFVGYNKNLENFIEPVKQHILKY